MRTLIALLFLAVALAGCASSPPKMQAPALQIAASHFSGTPLTGPTTRPVDIDTAPAILLANVQVLAIDQWPTGAPLHAVPSDAQLIAFTRGQPILLSTSRLTSQCYWGSGADAQQSQNQIAALGPAHTVQVSQSEIAIPAATTATIQLTDSAAPAALGKSSNAEILLNDASADPSQGSQLQLAIVMNGFLAEASEREPSGEESHPPPRPVSEFALLPPVPVTAPTTMALLIPFNFADAHAKAIYVLLNAKVAPKSDPQLADLLKQTSADLTKSEASAQPTAPVDISDWVGIQAALGGLDDPARRRVSLDFLCTQCNAPICEDVVLIVDDATLGKLTDLVHSRIKDSTVKPTRESLGWALDWSALKLMTQLQDQNRLPRDLLSILTRHTGQAGMDAGSVSEILGASADSKDFQTRVTAENFLYLEDTSPAARVRAYDWLAARNAAPAGYDPLAPAHQRQDALQKAMDAMTSQSPTPSGN